MSRLLSTALLGLAALAHAGATARECSDLTASIQSKAKDIVEYCAVEADCDAEALKQLAETREANSKLLSEAAEAGKKCDNLCDGSPDAVKQCHEAVSFGTLKKDFAPECFKRDEAPAKNGD